MSGPVIQLFPPTGAQLPLKGLYLAHALHQKGSQQAPWVYTNFVTSLDGRIALKDPKAGGYQVPKAIANPRDWRLFQELAAQADVLITGGRYVRDLARGQTQSTLRVGEAPGEEDLRAWRIEQGLPAQPALAVVSASLDLPLQALGRQDRDIYVITGEAAHEGRIKQLEREGATVIPAGDGPRVDGAKMVQALARLGFKTIYSTAGPQVLHTLLAAGVLARLYLTLTHQMLGGEDFATLLAGPLLTSPTRFELTSLYYDAAAPQGAGQCFAMFEDRA
jgi:riboflavin biosynthesis pyrimidine reductase